MSKAPPQQKTYLFGSKNKHENNPMLSIGRFFALDGSFGKEIYLDAHIPHIISIFGKRGYGKSYTLGVIIEELATLPKSIRKNLSVIIIDTLGIYWTMNHPNTQEVDLLKTWKIQPSSIPLKIYTPATKKQKPFMTKPNILSIPAYLLPADQWCELFQVKPTSPIGIALLQSIYNLQEQKKTFTLDDIFREITNNNTLSKETKDIAQNFYHYAKSLGIFSPTHNGINDLIIPGSINCIDISNLPSIHIKQMMTGIISDLIFQQRVQARKEEEHAHIQNQSVKNMIPKIWMAIDEAQLFLPKNDSHYCKKILIEQWLRQGRQPGLSLLLSSQQPSAIESEVFSHSDLIFCHRLTSQHDIQALQHIRPSYLHENIASIIEKMGYEKGVCAIIDDTMEQAHICKIRPRFTWHGGNEAQITTEKTHIEKQP